MKTFLAAFVSFLISAASVNAATQYVNGISWTYFVSNGEATIGNGSDTAIPLSSSGAVSVPSTLGGKPVTRIAAYAFADTDVSSVSIPSSVRSVADDAFWCCYDLSSISVASGNRFYKSVGGVLFSKDGTRLLAYPPLKSGTAYSVPSGVRTVGCVAFYGSRFLRSISFPASVESIDRFSFEICFQLSSVQVASGNRVYKCIDGNLYSKDGTRLIFCPHVNGSFVVPEGVRRIEERAFGATGSSSLRSLTFPSSLVSIGDSAFEGCSNLSSVDMPEGVSVIGPWVFNGCDSLQMLYVPRTVAAIGAGAFANWSDAGLKTLYLPSWFRGKTDGFGIPDGCRVCFYDPSGGTAAGVGPVFRFYSGKYKGHFFTSDAAEKDSLITTNPNWTYEGVAYSACLGRAPGTVPLFRFYSTKYRGHFFTIDEEEMWTVNEENPNWSYEGVAYYVYPAAVDGAVPVYRFWSKSYRHHFYTVDESEKNALIATNPNWAYEGEAFYALPAETAESGVKSLKKSVSSAAVAAAGEETRTGGRLPGNGSSEAAESGSSLRTAAPWTLWTRDGTPIQHDGSTELGTILVESRPDAPNAAELAAGADSEFDAEDANGSLAPETREPIQPGFLRLALPDGSWNATLWSATEGSVSEEPAEGSFDFDLPAMGVWHWLRIRDAAEENAPDDFSLWLRATAD